MSETRVRFLREIADRLGADRVDEVHLFTPIRQGGVESGVAVVAARLDRPAADAPEPPDDSWLTTDPPLERGTNLPDDAASAASPGVSTRLTIYSAHYRLQLKGADRGKWDFDLAAEADAPLGTVDDVVRGVVRRAGEAMEPERLSGDAFRAALTEEPWTASK
ncbi:MAG TPA: hypothetical protein VJ812_02635 [Gemmatimonadaceae bacterium]|jgi:hypothetical protein|nr:hypothetical protein [Gemmatimonadaceae bacterium]